MLQEVWRFTNRVIKMAKYEWKTEYKGIPELIRELYKNSVALDAIVTAEGKLYIADNKTIQKLLKALFDEREKIMEDLVHYFGYCKKYGNKKLLKVLMKNSVEV